MRGPHLVTKHRERWFTIASAASLAAIVVWSQLTGGAFADPTPPSVSPSAPPIGASPGDQAPQIEADTYTGHGLFRLSDHIGKPVVINFWYPSCAGCRVEKKFLKAANEKFAEQDVVFAGIQSTIFDSVDDGIAFLDDRGLTYPNIADDWKIPFDYKVIGYPQTVFLNPDHTIRTRTFTITDQGMIDSAIQGILTLSDS